MGGTARYRDTWDDEGTGEAVVRGDADRKVVLSTAGPSSGPDANPGASPRPDAVEAPLLRLCRSDGEHTYNLSLPA